jgi:catechol 2,3-dioxygenase-like lactoylglutathione lyase family enzyme
MSVRTKTTVSSVAVVSVPVSNQEKAKDFYVNTLGMELVRDDSSVPGMRWIQVAPPSGGTQLTLVTWFESMPAGSLRGLVLKMADLKGTYAKLSARGVRFDGPPAEQPWGLETVVYDPDGNGLVLQQA